MIQRRAVVAEPRRGAGEQHELARFGKRQQPVVLVGKGGVVAAAVDGGGRGVDVQGAQRRAAFKGIVADGLQIVKEGQRFHSAAGKGPRLDAAQRVRQDDHPAGGVCKSAGGDLNHRRAAQRIGKDKALPAPLPVRDGGGAVIYGKGEFGGIVLGSPLGIEPAAGLSPAAQPNGLPAAVRGGVPAGQGVAGVGEQLTLDRGIHTQMACGNRNLEPVTAQIVPVVEYGIAFFCRDGNSGRVADLRQAEGIAGAGACQTGAGIVCARQRIAVGRGQGEGHTLPRGNGCGLGLRCKRGRGFQNDAALHRRGCRGGGTACQQHQHGENKHQAAQVSTSFQKKSVFYIIIQNTPERKPPGVWMRKKLSR